MKNRAAAGCPASPSIRFQNRTSIMQGTLRSQLFSICPYAGFDDKPYHLDLQGWGSQHAVFRKVLEEVRPVRVIEVGTWKGASAIHMAGCLKELSLQAEVICIDTWMGAVEFWNDHNDRERYLSLGLKNGYPTVYYQFLANVVKSGFQDVITPFPQTSTIASRWLRRNSINADVIYIDGSHEEEDVMSDLRNFWSIVRPGGLMFGDDYDRWWPGVRSAVQRFGQEYGVQPSIDDEKWIIRKPEGWADSEAARSSRLSEIATATRFEVINEQIDFILRSIGADRPSLMRRAMRKAREKFRQISRSFLG